MKIQEITDPQILQHFVVQELMERAYPEDNLAVPGGFAGAPEEFVDMVLDPAFHVLVGAENGLLKATALLYIPPQAQTLRKAQVLHFYNEGSAALKRALVGVVVEKAKEKGHIKLIAVNGSGAPDSIWMRTFRTAGEWQKLGSMMELTVS